jgi:MoxR-like ATPase
MNPIPPAVTTAIAALRGRLESLVLGQSSAVEALLAGYLAGGHVLLEGVPGVAKTLLARSLAEALGLPFARIQFTPDLMPADVIGTHVFDVAERGFRLMRGPVFTQVLMADEINRTPPKTQAALLEAMQERQVTIDGSRLPLDPAFFVVATQNPLEFEGVYPLPEAQLDRFLLRIEIGLPGPAAERQLLERAVAGTLAGWDEGVATPPPVLPPAEAAALRHAARTVHVAPELLDYLVSLAEAVRSSPHVELGVSPRALLALLEVGRAGALLEGRGFLLPDDVKRFVVPCWAHRLRLQAESELEGESARRVLESAAAAVPVPHG